MPTRLGPTGGRIRGRFITWSGRRRSRILSAPKSLPPRNPPRLLRQQLPPNRRDKAPIGMSGKTLTSGEEAFVRVPRHFRSVVSAWPSPIPHAKKGAGQGRADGG